MLDRRWLTNNGPFVQELEQRLATFLGVRNCIAICNGTLALEIAIRALGMSGEVIVPSFTFVATAHALQWQEITPVFCDIDPRTHSLDPSRLERLFTPRTSGIIGVHLWGEPCDVTAIADIAAKRRVSLLYDASHAFGCSRNDCMVGNFGGAEVFSFHATKFFNTFEGGAIATNDDDLAQRVRMMRNFGFVGYDSVDYLGTNGKMSEISAAMGLTGLESLSAFLSTNRTNYHTYEQELRSIPGIKLYRLDETAQRNYQYIVLEVDEVETRISRDQLLRVLHAENVIARRYFYPGCHRMEPYRSLFPGTSVFLPETERIADRVLVLPTGTSIGKSDITALCNVLRIAVEKGGELTALLDHTSSGSLWGVARL
jgi:dTDP-4-amino-4,6-dideoxygalactose transaminase